MNNHCLKKLVTITLVSISLVACNNGNKTSSVQPQISPLQQYINSLTYTPANSNHLLTGGTNQQSFITPGGITINSIDIKFYSDIDCTGNLIYTNTLNGGGAENPVIPPDGTYTSTNASNNALCYNYANSTTRKTHCTGLYEDMSAGNMRSLQYTYNTNNGSIIGQCMYNPAATVGSTTGVEGIANWTTPTSNTSCTGTTCGFSQGYSTTLATPSVIIKVTNVGKNGFFSGGYGGQDLTKALVLPYNAESTASATVTLTYKNSGSTSATNFTTTFSPLPPGWTLTTHDCDNFTLQANSTNSCNDVYTFSSFGATSALLKQVNGVYPTNINASDIKQSWDEGSIHFANQPTVLPSAYSNQIIYVNYFLKIFVTEATTTGQLSTVVGGNDAISNADAICATDANKPGDGYTYKAMLVTSTDNIVTPTPDKDRYVCKSVNCVGGGEQSFDWVLLSESVNYRTVGSTTNTTSIGTTAANYGYLLNSSAFSTIVNNVWTGFSLVYSSWMSAPYAAVDPTTAGGSCNNWTSADAGLYGTYGRANGAGYNGPIAYAAYYCNNSQHLYCAQQVEPKRIFVTNTTTSGNIVGTSGKSAAAAADAICNSDSARPNSGAYKALLVTSTRYNDGNGTSSDWPLKAGASYYNMVGLLSFTALGNGLPPNTFSNVIDPSSAYTVWTGAGTVDASPFAVSWTQPAEVGEICSDWTGDGTNMTNSAIAGAPQNNNSAAWNYNGGSGSTCTDKIPLYCVQQ